MTIKLAEWIAAHGIERVECLIADMNGILRGKSSPAEGFVADAEKGALRMASSLLAVSLTGAYAGRPGHDDIYRDPDLTLRLDPESLCRAPGAEEPTALVFADVFHANGSAWTCAPRQVLKAVVARLAEKGLVAAVAPELEFYLIADAKNPTQPLTPAAAPSGRPLAPSPGGLEALAGHAQFTQKVLAQSRVAGLELDAAICESGAGQLEINLSHGDPVRRADQSLIFKRIVREAARSFGLGATFMAKPLEDQAPSGLHLHVSLVDAKSGRNIFADERGADSADFRCFIGGLQTWLPEVAPLYAPNVNSFRRLRPRYSAPINIAWGHDNRTCGLRVPLSDAANRRIEVRLPGADANPYLATAATLGAGFLGLRDRVEPAPEAAGNAYHGARTLPRTMEEGLQRFAACGVMRELLGDVFVASYVALKEAELESFWSELSPWERNHLPRQI